MNQNQKGFSAIEFILLIAILGLVVGIGYYTWRMNNQRQETHASAKDTQQPQKTDEPIKEEADINTISKNWKRFESGRGALSIKFADGLNGIRVNSSDWFFFRDFTLNDNTATIRGIDDYGGDGFTAFSILKLQRSEFATPGRRLNLQSTSFETYSGLKGTKISYSEPYDPPCEGIGCDLGGFEVEYQFENSKDSTVTRVFYSRRVANAESKRIYNIIEDDPDHTDIVDAMVKTLQFND